MTPLGRWRAVMVARGLSSAEKAVLGCLAYHADETSLEAWPSLETLSLETGFGRTACWKAVRTLEAYGAISAIARSEGRHSNRYRVNLDEPSAWRTVERAARRTVQAANPSPGERLNLPSGEFQPAARRMRTCRPVNANNVLNLVMNGKSGNPPSAPNVWDLGIGILGQGKRSLLAKLIRTHGEEAVAAAVAVTSAKRPAEPASYLQGILASQAKRRRLNGAERTLDGPL